jgi:L-aminopeptidase/D-esterase-like protein
MLHTDRRLTEIHGIVLAGGSAFGLAAADGVVAWLEERDVGYETAAGRVPIVPAAVVYDLGTGRSDVRPGPDAGRRAAGDAAAGDVPTGPVGAGTGATVGKWAGFERAAPGGVGVATVDTDAGRAFALAVVNAVGDVIDARGEVVRGAGAAADAGLVARAPRREVPPSTVLAVVAVEAAVDKREARWLASRGADGITVSVRPAHTRYDGDVVIAAGRFGPAGGADLDLLGPACTQAVADAVRDAVRT